ncbi:MAG: CotH kinase family protein [Paludibacter sp.]
MKNIRFLTIILLFFIALKIYALTDSNFPIVIITTDNNPSTGKPYEIPDDPKVLANMKIIYHPDGTRNYVSDQNTAVFLNYTGRIGIEKRGSSSQELPKKPYGLTTLKSDNITNNNVSILGMPKENDWVLNSLAFDPSLIRDFLSYELYKNIGNYSPREMYCEVIVNGDYKGLYIFMEKLKVDSERINVLKLTTTDNSNPNVTGGYVTKCDKTTGNDPVAWSMSSVNFIHESPDPEVVTAQQTTYIRSQFTALQSVMTAQNSSIINGYPSIIDVPTFVDFMLMNELASNPDGYTYSTYFHKDRNGKLKAGPIWDFNLTYGNDLFSWGFDRSHTDVWQFNDGDNVGAKFWRDLFANPTFLCYMSKRWIELTASNQPLNYSVIANRIDQLVSLVSEAAVREQAKWGTVGNQAAQISAIKTWLQNRIIWLNARLSSAQTCSNVSLPALVISKIHYNPTMSGANLSDSLEFIEITNNSNVTVNLTGIYFRELGITYQFPVNSTIGANQKIYLSSNSKVFELFYGLKSFGQFTRTLSNKTQKLVLADAFGNIIDKVEYFDSSPWPIEADGIGAFLELVNLNSDNSNASNWISSNKVLGINDIRFDNNIKIYPTQAQATINIFSNNLTIKSYKITDILGKVVIDEISSYSQNNKINIEKLSPNIYFLILYFDNGKSAVRKFVKI